MSVLKKVKIASYGSCCGAYTLLVTGFHIHILYLIIAMSYAAIMMAEMKR